MDGIASISDYTEAPNFLFSSSVAPRSIKNMGFDYHVNVEVAYVQEVGYMNCYSRLATRCLKLRIDPSRTKMPKATKKLPGEDLPQEVDDAPFSDSEEQLKTMEPAHHELYTKLKGYMNGNHANEDEIMDYVDGEELVNKCFQVAVERLMPGHGCKFALCIKSNGGAYGEADEQAGATYQMAYIKYLPTHCTAGGGLDAHRGGINVPWGNKLTPVHMLDRKERVQVDAAFAVLIDKLGLTKTGEPGMKLISAASGG